ncbi:hypothetical protein GSI_02256 [Ganoderma sinense ZZ0214-1]|uniref:Uncharacterized protein n=1 Tax=Ganoderma sinense ZZ0214-1 TaxID=1077348 RepID=A0A2G8SPM6_9APHY|nr:hypothetical protein GSI_02256 [Ganoderma sinense ZZ0214-1]
MWPARRSGKCVLEPHFARILPCCRAFRFRGEMLRAKTRDAIGPRGLDCGPALLLPLRGSGALWLVMGGASRTIEARSSNGHRSIWTWVHYPTQRQLRARTYSSRSRQWFDNCAPRIPIDQESGSVEVGLSYRTELDNIGANHPACCHRCEVKHTRGVGLGLGREDMLERLPGGHMPLHAIGRV